MMYISDRTCSGSRRQIHIKIRLSQDELTYQIFVLDYGSASRNLRGVRL